MTLQSASHEPSPPSPPITIGLNAVIVSVTSEVPRILTVKRTAQHVMARDAMASSVTEGDEANTLPFGPWFGVTIPWSEGCALTEQQTGL